MQMKAKFKFMQISSDTMQQLPMAEKTVKLMWSAYCQMLWSSVDDGGENHFSILYDLFLPTYSDIHKSDA